MKIRVRAPSNIALVKYMGKTDAKLNLPENPSLSMTLNALCTYLEIEIDPDGANGFRFDPGMPETPPGTRTFPVAFKPEAASKFERHYRRVQSRMAELAPARADQPSVTVRSVNTFPSNAGIASSASSFAALTLASFLANARDLPSMTALLGTEKGIPLRRKLSRVSREGSGSSCRSFEGPWVQWEREDASACASRLPEIAHFVIIVSGGEKKVPSSQAHQLVKRSPLWNGRVERAQARFNELRAAIGTGDWPAIARLAWSEMWEMHSLFHTCAEPFTYWDARTIEALHFFSGCFNAVSGSEPPPIVTLDAGPNVHVLVPAQRRVEWRERLAAQFPNCTILEDAQGRGAEIL